MKNLSLFLTIIFALILISCGAKKEKTEELASGNNGITEEPLDNDTSFSDFVDQGFTQDTVSYDTVGVEKTVSIDPTKGIQIDPPVVTKKEEPKEVIRTLETKNIEKTHETRYYVVAGSFKKYSNAQNLRDYFKRKGYKPLILPKVKGYNRVAIISFPKEAEARTSIKNLRAEHNDLTFWLYKW